METDFNLIFYFLLIILLIGGCNGPAFPKRDGKAYMEQKGYPNEIIEAVIYNKQLSPERVVEFSNSKSLDVRYLVAGNPFLASEEIDLYINDKNDFVRSGVALNPNLTGSQIDRVFKDSSHTVYSKLAGNPTVPKEILLKLHRERNPGLVYFALNPRCPQEIKNEILSSNDNLAKKWLETKNERSEQVNSPNPPTRAAPEER